MHKNTIQEIVYQNYRNGKPEEVSRVASIFQHTNLYSKSLDYSDSASTSMSSNTKVQTVENRVNEISQIRLSQLQRNRILSTKNTNKHQKFLFLFCTQFFFLNFYFFFLFQVKTYRKLDVVFRRFFLYSFKTLRNRIFLNLIIYVLRQSDVYRNFFFFEGVFWFCHSCKGCSFIYFYILWLSILCQLKLLKKV